MSVVNVLQPDNNTILKNIDKGGDEIFKIDKTKCMASKSIKELHIQCPYKPKEDSLFCGRHRNTKSEQTIEEYYLKLTSSATFKEDSITSNKKNNNKLVLNQKCKYIIITIENYNEDPELKQYSKKSIRDSYHYYRLDYYRDNKEKNVDVMCIQLKKFFKRLLYFQIPKVLEKISLLQKLIKKRYSAIISYYRGPVWNDVKLCNNDTDFFNFDKLGEIPLRYRITYKDTEGFIYGFHLFSLQELLSRKEKNPYTMKEFPKGLDKKVNSYISIIKKWLTLDKINLHYYKNNKIYNLNLNNNKIKKSRRYQEVNNGEIKINEELTGNIIEKSKNIINKLPVKQLSQIQCSQTFSIMIEIGYQVQPIWLYGKSIKQLSRFITYLEYTYDINNFNNPLLSAEELINIPLLRFANDINTGNLGTSNKYKLLQRVLEVLNYMLNTLGTGDYKNTITIMIIQSLAILEPNAVKTSNPWLQ